MNRAIILITCLTGTLLINLVEAQKSPTVPADTVSPNGQYGVTVPAGDEYPETDGNSVVEAATGKVVCVVQAVTGAIQQNHGGYTATWTKDSHFLLWVVAGKWFPRSIVLIDLEDEENVKQLNILKACQDEILKRVKEHSPEKYAATKAEKDAGRMGSAYPDGFTVMFDFVEDDELPLPFEIDLTLTNDPKGFSENDPEFAARLLNASMKASVAEDFSIEFSDFEMEQ